MIFLYTCSQDVTSDILAAKLAAEAEVFRFDIDRNSDYVWSFGPDGWSCAHSSGRRISSSSIRCFHLRKPMFMEGIDVPAQGCLENWRRKELQTLFKNLFDECDRAGMAALVHSDCDKWGKPAQMRIAARHFRVPEWRIFGGSLPELPQGKDWVVKSLAQTMIGAGKCFLVREADPATLDLSYPWFIQEKVDGEEEVSAAYVEGRIFASSISRAVFGTVDSRLETFRRNLKWTPVELPGAEKAAIRAFMAEIGLSFGRFDFIRKDGVLNFLEVNPNGQWAWLDVNDERGLVSAVAEAILAVERRGRSLADRWR